MEPEAMWRLCSGVKRIASKLSRTALQMEQGLEVSCHLYAMVAEASKLLPLFSTYADTLASGPADAHATGALRGAMPRPLLCTAGPQPQRSSCKHTFVKARRFHAALHCSVEACIILQWTPSREQA